MCLAIACGACNGSDDRMERLIAQGTEISKLKAEYLPAVTELGSVAIKIENLMHSGAAGGEQSREMVQQAHTLIEEAFDAGKRAHEEWSVGDKGMDFETYFDSQEANLALLVDVIEKTKTALEKSRQVLELIGREEQDSNE